MKTYLHNPANKSSKWYIVDATNVPLGRLASQVATVLRGKNKPEFTPNVDAGDHVIVINCDKVALTGKKMEQKFYRYHTLYVGGLKEIKYSTLLKDKSDFAVYEAVRGMLPKNRIGRKMIKKLRCYTGSEHGHEAQMPEVLNIEGKRA